MKKHHASAILIWFADNSNKASTLPSICDFFTKLYDIGKDYRYFLGANGNFLFFKLQVQSQKRIH